MAKGAVERAQSLASGGCRDVKRPRSERPEGVPKTVPCDPLCNLGKESRLKLAGFPHL